MRFTVQLYDADTIAFAAHVNANAISVYGFASNLFVICRLTGLQVAVMAKRQYHRPQESARPCRAKSPTTIGSADPNKLPTVRSFLLIHGNELFKKQPKYPSRSERIVYMFV